MRDRLYRIQTRLRQAITLVAASLAVAACGGAGAQTVAETLTSRSVDVAALFAPPTQAELAEVRAYWAAFDGVASDPRIEASFGVEGGDVMIVSHEIPGGRHFGAVVLPHAPDPVPVSMFLTGFGPPFNVPLDAIMAGSIVRGTVQVIPSYRGQTLTYQGQTWQSGGELFDQCDGGSDDVLLLLDAARQLFDLPTAERVAVTGSSRGGNVALILGLRLEGVVAAISIAGPTSYLVEDYAAHPNMHPLFAEWFVAPLLEGDAISADAVAESRQRMLRCSPLHFAADLPPLQIHHGEQDAAVPITSATDLETAWRDSGNPNTLELWFYENEGHTFENDRTLIERRMRAWNLLIHSGETP